MGIYTKNSTSLWYQGVDRWIPGHLTVYVDKMSWDSGGFGHMALDLRLPGGFEELPELMQCEEMALCHTRYGSFDDPRCTAVVHHMRTMFMGAEFIQPVPLQYDDEMLTLRLNYTIRVRAGGPDLMLVPDIWKDYGPGKTDK